MTLDDKLKELGVNMEAVNGLRKLEYSDDSRMQDFIDKGLGEHLKWAVDLVEDTRHASGFSGNEDNKGGWIYDRPSLIFGNSLKAAELLVGAGRSDLVQKWGELFKSFHSAFKSPHSEGKSAEYGMFVSDAPKMLQKLIDAGAIDGLEAWARGASVIPRELGNNKFGYYLYRNSVPMFEALNEEGWRDYFKDWLMWARKFSGHFTYDSDEGHDDGYIERTLGQAVGTVKAFRQAGSADRFGKFFRALAPKPHSGDYSSRTERFCSGKKLIEPYARHDMLGHFDKILDMVAGASQGSEEHQEAFSLLEEGARILEPLAQNGKLHRFREWLDTSYWHETWAIKEGVSGQTSVARHYFQAIMHDILFEKITPICWGMTKLYASDYDRPIVVQAIMSDMPNEEKGNRLSFYGEILRKCSDSAVAELFYIPLDKITPIRWALGRLSASDYDRPIVMQTIMSDMPNEEKGNRLSFYGEILRECSDSAVAELFYIPLDKITPIGQGLRMLYAEDFDRPSIQQLIKSDMPGSVKAQMLRHYWKFEFRKCSDSTVSDFFDYISENPDSILLGLGKGSTVGEDEAQAVRNDMTREMIKYVDNGENTFADMEEAVGLAQASSRKLEDYMLRELMRPGRQAALTNLEKALAIFESHPVIEPEPYLIAGLMHAEDDSEFDSVEEALALFDKNKRIIPTEYLFSELLDSKDKKATYEDWVRLMDSFAGGNFDDDNELHRNLEYTRFKRIVDHKKVRGHVKNHFTFEDYLSIFNRNPEGMELLEGDRFEIECAAYESSLLVEDLLRLNEHAKSMGKGVVVVPNFSYGYLPVAPTYDQLEEAGIDVILGSKVASTKCHSSKEVIDSRFLKGKRTKIMDSQPFVVVVDGSNHILDREGGENKKARNPDAYIGISNQIIAINDALGFNENNTPELRKNYESFGKTDKDLARLRRKDEFQRLVRVLREVDRKAVKKVTGKRVVFDLDNTLIGSEGQVRPHAVELLDKLVGDQNEICIWTYGKKDETEAKLRAAGLEKYVSIVVAQEDYKVQELRQDTLKDIRKINGDILIDNRDNNVRNAQKAGIKAIKVSSYKGGKSKDLRGLYRAISKALEPEQEGRRPYLFGSRNDLDKDLIIRFNHKKIGEMPNLRAEGLNQPHILLRVAGVTHDLLPDEIRQQCPDDIGQFNNRYKREFYNVYGPCHVPAYWDDSRKILDFDFGYDEHGVRYLNRLETEIKKAYARQTSASELSSDRFMPELVRYIERHGRKPTVCGAELK
jgi:phosphoglycolate phosphatase-like HAD superfamily hydrolase